MSDKELLEEIQDLAGWKSYPFLTEPDDRLDRILDLIKNCRNELR